MPPDAKEILLPTPDAIHAAFDGIWPLERRMDRISVTALAAGPEQSASVAAAYVAGYLEDSHLTAFSSDAAWNAALTAFDELFGIDDDALPF